MKGTLFLSHQFQNRFADFGGGSASSTKTESSVAAGSARSRTGAIGDDIPVQVLLGSNWRTDVLEAFQAPARARAVRRPAVINVGLTETNVAGFGQVQVKPLPWLKFTAGGRYDQFYYDIDDRITPGGTPNISNGIASPKAGVAITPVKWLELFANYGEGFRSIDVPAELIGNPGIQPFRIVSREGGFQTTFDRFRFLASYWNTNPPTSRFSPQRDCPSRSWAKHDAMVTISTPGIFWSRILSTACRCSRTSAGCGRG